MSKITGNEAMEFIDSNCTKIANDDSGWETLYKANSTNEYWILSYPNSGEHGGGEPSMILVTPEEANEKFAV